ncbi:MAG TPA: response regulator [Acidobacteriota bacterium]|nr:response regulator [Acidobacteriota bacterium]
MTEEENQALRVLMVEDEETDALFCRKFLERNGYSVSLHRVDAPDDLERALESSEWDIVLSDYRMPQFNALDALRIVRRFDKDIPFIVVTGALDEETAVECVMQGADNYVLKGNLARLGTAVRQALETYRERCERQRLEEELRQAQRMETVGQLASGVAHDFNNLLTVIMAHTELLEGCVDGSPEVDRSLNALREAASQASGVTRSLLAFGRKLQSRKEPVETRQALLKASMMFQRTLPSNIRLKMQVANDLPYVFADKVQLQQVLLNLILNARDAMPDGGAIEVRADSRPPALVRLQVADEGHGMTPEIQARIFEPFFTTKPDGQGTGMGLSVIRTIVEDHNGEITVESEAGRGTTFTVTLPVCQQVSINDQGDHRAPAPGRGKRVLLAEDNQQLRGIIAGALRALGYDILEAADGESLLDVFERQKDEIGLLILDKDLPKISGMDCLRRIRACGYDTQAVMITGQVLAEDALAEIPNAQLLPKPFRMTELTAKMEKRQ